MKILYVTSSAYPFHSSGVATVIKNISKELKKRGYEIYVFTLTTSKEYRNNAILEKKTEEYELKCIVQHDTIDDFFYSFTHDSYDNKFVESYFIEYIRKIKPDIVHFHAIQGLGANLINIAKKYGCGTAVTMHDWWWLCPNYFMADITYEKCKQQKIDLIKCYKCINEVNKVAYKREKEFKIDAEAFLNRRNKMLIEILERDTDIVIPVSQYLAKYFNEYNLIDTRIFVNFNGVEVPKTTKECLDKKKEKIVFGFLGGMNQLKGYDIVKEAFSTLKIEGWELRIYGIKAQSNTNLKKVYGYIKECKFKALIIKIKELIAKKRSIIKSENIKYFPSFRDEEKDDVFKEIDILIANSIVQESSSLVVREALIRNIPVIISASGGPEEVVKDGFNGKILMKNTADEVKEVVEDIVSKYPNNKWNEYMKENRYNYIYSSQVNELEEIYRQIINKKDNVNG